MNEKQNNKKPRMTCKEYCNVWNDIDKDCEIYGEHHFTPRTCPHYIIDISEKKKTIEAVTIESSGRSETPVQALDICEITLEKTTLGEICVTCYTKRNNQFVYRMVAKNKKELVKEIKRAQRKSMQEYDNIITERLKALDELIQVKNQMVAVYNESIHKIEES